MMVIGIMECLNFFMKKRITYDFWKEQFKENMQDLENYARKAVGEHYIIQFQFHKWKLYKFPTFKPSLLEIPHPDNESKNRRIRKCIR
jgi:hypothetical protein